MIDYLRPRERTIELLGDAARDILDGRREPRPEERLGGLLRGVELKTFTHLMDRSPDGAIFRLDVLQAEDVADRLALELLAPYATAVDWLEELKVQWREPSAFDVAKEALMRCFGLPGSVAGQYGQQLVMSRRPARSFREWLGV